MIELNSKTQQDFLNREWVQKLLDAGVDMSDAYYMIGNNNQTDYIIADGELDWLQGASGFIESSPFKLLVPTYTVSELMYKLHEYIEVSILGKKYMGGYILYKDALFYPAYYFLLDSDDNCQDDYLRAEYEHPIESLASLLLQCVEKGVGYVKDINDKK